MRVKKKRKSPLKSSSDDREGRGYSVPKVSSVCSNYKDKGRNRGEEKKGKGTTPAQGQLA